MKMKVEDTKLNYIVKEKERIYLYFMVGSKISNTVLP